METFTHILASLDIFQVIINAFPQIFNPLMHAFEGIYRVMLNDGKQLFSSHPGLFSGIFIFLLGYISVAGIQRMRRFFMPVLKNS
ncbi:MAG: hypothetical protein NT040_06405 [Bacteroidetes bacterium]|nr:hypothetical protein [Bacteroidota bacterium]